MYLLSQFIMCNKVWARVNTQIRSCEILQLKADTGVRLSLLKETQTRVNLQ